MSFPPSYGDGHYPDIYGAGSPSTPNQQQPPGAFPQWETLESAQARAHDMHSLQSSHHSTPMHTPIATSFQTVELEEPPYLVPSQSHLSQTGSPASDAPVLLHNPHSAQLQHQQYLAQQPQYDYLVQPQEQQQPGYSQMHHMGPPDSSTLFRAPQQPSGVYRSIPSSRGRAAESHPYYRRASGGAVPNYQSHDSRGGSVESPLTPLVVSPVPSTSGGDVSTPLPSVTPSLPPPAPPRPPSPPAKVTTRRTRSAAKPKASVRFEAGTKTTSGPAPSTRVPVTRSSTPGPTSSPDSRARSTTPVPRSSTRKGTSLARTPPPSQATATSTSAAASGSGSGKASKATWSTLHQTSSTSTSTSPTSLPKPSSAASSSMPPPAASTQTPSSAHFHAYASKFLQAAPVSTIRADIQYSMRTHIMTASMEIPGVKAEHIHIRLGTSYHTRTKSVVVLALCLPAFMDDADGDEVGGRHGMHGTVPPSNVARPTERSDVQMRKEEEEEEEEGESIPTADATMQPPAAEGHGAQSPPGASSTSTSEPKSLAETLWETHGPYRPGQAMRRLTGTDVGFVGRVANPNIRERRYGTMRRVLRVPSNTELEHISARIESGVLTVQIDCGEPMMFDDSVEIPVHVVS